MRLVTRACAARKARHAASVSSSTSAGGARVALSGTRASVLERARAELDPDGRRTLTHAGHITTREQAQTLVAEVLERFGAVDVLVNSTGIFRPVPFTDQTEDHLEEALGSILRPTF
jgi:NAD(P)-dependent dehydrogenase (short-subunit alcohol dehydrogenase family)